MTAISVPTNRQYDQPNTGRWLAAGLTGGLLLVGVMLSLRLLLRVPSQIERVQDPLFQLIPGVTFGILIDHFQYWGKPIALMLTAVALVLAGIPVAFALLALINRYGRSASDCFRYGTLLWPESCFGC